MKILVADDSNTSLALIEASLKKLGHDVLPAKNGKQAIELFKSNRPDLVILDVMMDEMNGFDCASKIREIDKEDWIPIIFLSSSVDDENIAKGIDSGGDDYLAKPFSQVTLAAKIKAMQRIADMRFKLFEAKQKLNQLSITDTLTNIYNRLQFNRVIEEKIVYAKEHNLKFSVLFLDLDKFKSINDTLGHHAGDLLLIEVSKRLLSCLRKADFIARIGGDEFAIILDYTDNRMIAESCSQNILDSLSPSYNLEGDTVQVTISIGIAEYPTDGVDREALLSSADIAMYQAKKLGRNNFQFYTPELLKGTK